MKENKYIKYNNTFGEVDRKHFIQNKLDVNVDVQVKNWETNVIRA